MEFLHRQLSAVGKRVFRLGLAANYGIDEAGVRAAFDRGVNYVFFTPRGTMARPLRDALARDRDQLVVSAGTTIGWLGGSVRRSAERTMKKLGVSHLDVFQLSWLGVGAVSTHDSSAHVTHGTPSARHCSITGRFV